MSAQVAAAARSPKRINRFFTDEELGFIEENSDWSHQRIADELGRTRDSIAHIRMKLRRGWTRIGGEPWTLAEDEVLIEAGPWVTVPQLTERLPGRTRTAIVQRRVALGLDTIHGGRKNPNHVGARPLIAKSCTTCGRLLHGSWFHFRPNRQLWEQSCKKCGSEGRADLHRSADRANSTSEWNARVQALTLSRATNHKQPWTDKDHETLADPDLTTVAKALALGRSYAAVKDMCQANGYRSSRFLGEPTDLWRIFNPNQPEQVAA